jgi:putative iron-dependent peroxidase
LVCEEDAMTVQRIPQAVIGPVTPAAIFLTLVVEPGREQAARDALAEVSGLVRAVGMRSLDDGLTCVTGIGAAFWDRAFTAPRPEHLHPFQPLDGPRRAPATPGDLLFHIRAGRMDMCFELAQRLGELLRGTARIIDEVHGFRYWDARNMLGFVDGTENPTGPARAEVALTGDDSDHPASSYVIVQRYTHDLDGWRALTVEQQEAAIGRTKLSDIEIPDGQKAPNSHVSLNVIEDADGTEHEILRDNMPFGSVADGTFGTYFIGYAADVTTTERMLRNMFLGDPAGTTDRILDFSTAQTGALFFVPSQDELDDPDLLDQVPASAVGQTGVAAGETAADVAWKRAAAPAGPAPAEGSLGVGALRGSPQHRPGAGATASAQPVGPTSATTAGSASA